MDRYRSYAAHVILSSRVRTSNPVRSVLAGLGGLLPFSKEVENDQFQSMWAMDNSTQSQSEPCEARPLHQTLSPCFSRPWRVLRASIAAFGGMMFL